MNILKTIYYKFFPSNTNAHKLFWRFRYIFNRKSLDPNEIEISVGHPHRKEIINEFKKFSDIKKVLEIGSSWGPNLLLLNKYFPKISYTGIDISKQKIDAGNEFFKVNNIDNIILKHIDLTTLDAFEDSEFDIILTDAVLIYVDPKHIINLANEITRIASKGLILIEFDNDNNDPMGSVYETNWVRDYGSLLSPYSDKIEKRCFTENIWPGKWSFHGKIITVFLNRKEIYNERII